MNVLGLSVTEIADYFRRDIAAISKGITKTEKQIMSDISLQKTVQETEIAVRELNEEKYANS